MVSDSGLDCFGNALNNTLDRLDDDKTKPAKDAPPYSSSLSETTIAKTFSELEKHIKSPFSCGGIIDVADAKPSKPPAKRVKTDTSSSQSRSSPVSIYWTNTTGSPTQKLVLPLQNPEALQQLVKDCEPATFGKGKEDVLDTEYRKAGKMDTGNFATTFHPADFGIVENIEQLLLPSISTEEENSLGFRRLRVELYKLNIYSGPSGLFRKHVDTPRSESQIGSLVVCLPSKFKGGKFTVQHAERSVEFDWASRSDSAIQWAAFYSDCQHEIETVSEGERITLTYNLYVTEPVEVYTQAKDIVQPKSLPLYGFLSGLMAELGFMKNGGVLGVYCSHAYPHSSEHAKAMLPRGLKGSDLMVYSVLKSLSVEVKVLPILGETEFEGEAYDDDEDAERGPKESNKGQKRVGKELWGHTDLDMVMEIREDYENELNSYWKSYLVKGVTWISEPKHSQRAITYIAYGNQASIGTVYSCAAILAVIPPYDERKGVVEQR